MRIDEFIADLLRVLPGNNLWRGDHVEAWTRDAKRLYCPCTVTITPSVDIHWQDPSKIMFEVSNIRTRTSLEM
jgi:hypothetical protein